MNKPKTIVELNAGLITALKTLNADSKPRHIKAVQAVFIEAYNLLDSVLGQDFNKFDTVEAMAFLGRIDGEILPRGHLRESLIRAVSDYYEAVSIEGTTRELKRFAPGNFITYVESRFGESLVTILALATYRADESPMAAAA